MEQYFFTPTDISKILKIPKRSVYRLLKINALAAIRVGKLLRVSRKELNRFTEKRKGTVVE